MILPSNACPLTQPNNHASSYIIDWESPLLLNGKWEVALTDYSLNNSPQFINTKIDYTTLNNKSDFIKLKIINDKSIETHHWENDSMNFHEHLKFEIMKNGKIKISSTYFGRISIGFESLEIATKLGFSKLSNNITENAQAYSLHPNEVIAANVFEKGYSKNTMISITYLDDIEKSFTIKFERYSMKCSFEETEQYFEKHCPNLFEEFKIDQNGILKFILKPEVKKIIIEDNLKILLGLQIRKMDIVSRHSATGISKVLIRNPINQLYIYSSLVDPILVGGVKVPLLRLIWLESNFDENHSETVDVPMYLHTSRSSINNIEFQIRDDSGQLIKFPFGSKTSLTLHFREIT